MIADVLVVGGGPGGSTCAWKLVQAGLTVTVIDAAVFPRDKVCAGWITPQVVDELRLDVDDYRRGRTFQPIDGFRVGVIGRAAASEAAYARPVSYGIRRCEFDHYLLARSGASLAVGERVDTIARRGGVWVVNDRHQAPILVGAGGHFCPVARRLNPAPRRAQVVAAQEVEFEAELAASGFSRTRPSRPELYFSPDLRGYGWIFHKQSVVNVGYGSLEHAGLPRASDAFVAFLERQGRLAGVRDPRWRGHAYRLYEPDPSRIVEDEGVLLVGDAAGLAYAESGEGIRPAVESGLLAAETVVARDGGYTARLRRRFGAARPADSRRVVLPPGAIAAAGRELLRLPWFVRRVVLDRWFLHAGEDAIAS